MAKGRPVGLSSTEKAVIAVHMSAVYRRGIEAEILTDNPPHAIQLPNRYSRKMAWSQLSDGRCSRAVARRIINSPLHRSKPPWPQDDGALRHNNPPQHRVGRHSQQ